MKNTILNLTGAFAVAVLMSSCIGDDIIMDTVEERFELLNSIDSLQINDEFQINARFLNNIGVQENRTITWSSSDATIASVDNNGLVTGLALGNVTITGEVETTEGVLTDELSFIVTDEEVEEPSGPSVTSRSGVVVTTTFYTLEGTMTLEDTGNGLILSLADDYQASSSLPGLYVYLTNNPNTINNALEVGKVETFSGAHSFEVPGDVGLFDYSHVLYFCKPFSVKVGDGVFEN